MARELRVLQHQIANGADFILTQPVFDIAGLQNFIDAYESEYDVLDVPLIVGVLPLNSERHTAFLHNEVPGIEIPDSIRTRVFAAKDGIADWSCNCTRTHSATSGSWKCAGYLFNAALWSLRPSGRVDREDERRYFELKFVYLNWRLS